MTLKELVRYYIGLERAIYTLEDMGCFDYTDQSPAGYSRRCALGGAYFELRNEAHHVHEVIELAAE